MTCVGKHQVLLYFQLWEIMFSWGTKRFSVWNTLIWFNRTIWWKYWLQDKCVEEDTHNDGLCISFSLSSFSRLCMWAAPLSLWPASAESLGCVHSTVLKCCSYLVFYFWMSQVSLWRLCTVLHSWKIQNIQIRQTRRWIRLLVVLAICNEFLHILNS